MLKFKFLKVLKLVVTTNLCVITVNAAEVAVVGGEIILTGEITSGDFQQFQQASNNLPRGTVVRLQSPGGLTREGLAIGKLIRDRRFKSFASVGYCASSCALIWLGGIERWIGSNARVGFHQSYTVDGRNRLIPSVRGNAVVGAYIGRLGYSDRAVEFATKTPPNQLAWLTPELGRHYQISYSAGPPPKSQSTVLAKEETMGAPGMYARAWELYASGDHTAAVSWYRRAAEQDYAPALVDMGKLYEGGIAVVQNKTKALEWYQKAADMGHSGGQVLAAFFYHYGDVVVENKYEAVRLWRAAAVQGNIDGQFMLGSMYELGEGIDKDIAKATFWYRQAADRGDLDAKDALQHLGG